MKPLSAVLALALSIPATASAVSTATRITYASDGGAATIQPFTINEPTSGLDLEIAPAINFTDGSFVTLLTDLSDGPATLDDFTLNGSLDVDISTTVSLGPINLPVSATITGPLVLNQRTTSVGSLVAATAYVETNPGNYDILLGPLDCNDTAFGAVCGAVETALGIEFPLPAQNIEDTPFPFTAGIFSDLDQPGLSTVTAEFDFSVPVGEVDPIDIGASTQLVWTEAVRETVLIPEPSTSFLLLLAIPLLIRRPRDR